VIRLVFLRDHLNCTVNMVLKQHLTVKLRTSKNYSYSGTLQIMALASVLGVPIETVYPDQNHKLLPVYQNIFRPRQLINPTSSEVV